ncbi:MAG: T9SS type A sorting domain-containing protein, partial [Bacteroidales bacterium]|nr:T9SS type A sorting domain-containing protein [Bacteroidales bacterium]
MKRYTHIKSIGFFVGLTLLISLNQTVSAQLLSGYLTGKATIGANPTLFCGDLIIGRNGELFFGSSEPRLQQKNTFFYIGNYEGEVGAKIHLSVTNNSNDYGTHGFFDIVGKAVGSTEIVLDMFPNWDGSRIELVRAYNADSDSAAFAMQENVYNERLAYLGTCIEGNDRIWFLAERKNETVITVPNTRIIAYPNPTTTSQPLVVVDVETNDEELLTNGIIIVYDLIGHRLGQVRTNGHRTTPVQLPPQTGMYILMFVSNKIEKAV